MAAVLVLRLTAAIAALLLLVAGSPGLVRADRGVALDIGSISVDDPVAQGRAYALPTVGVRNPGTEPARYRMGMSVDGEQTARAAEWFSFEPREFELAPGAEQEVAIRLVVPEDARPMDYEGLITASLATEGSGARVGAAAAARVSFSVRSGGFVSDLVVGVGELFRAWLPWSVIGPAILLALAGVGLALRAASRRYAFRIERRG
jgi:hypothetical protein